MLCLGKLKVNIIIPVMIYDKALFPFNEEKLHLGARNQNKESHEDDCSQL